MSKLLFWLLLAANIAVFAASANFSKRNQKPPTPAEWVRQAKAGERIAILYPQAKPPEPAEEETSAEDSEEPDSEDPAGETDQAENTDKSGTAQDKNPAAAPDEAKPAEGTTAKTAEKAPVKPPEETAAKQSEKAPAKPAEETPGKPAEKAPAKPAGSSQAKPAAECIAAGIFTPEEADGFEKRAALPAGMAERLTNTVPSKYMLYVPPAKTAEAAEKTIEALKEKGITSYYLMPKGKLKNAISLGIFKTKEAAEKLAADLAGKDIKGLKIEGIGKPAKIIAFRIKNPTALQLEQVDAALAAFPDASRSACPDGSESAR